MADIQVSNIYAKGEDGVIYRHTVTVSPPTRVTVTRTERNWLFWTKEVTKRIPLETTTGSLWWKKPATDPEAYKALEGQVHDLALAHMAQFGKDFEEVTINAAGATFDSEPIQDHNFSVIDPAFVQTMTDYSSKSAADEYHTSLSTQYAKKTDVKATDLFAKFAGCPVRKPSPPPSPVSTHGSMTPRSTPLPTPSHSPRVSPLSSRSESPHTGPHPPPLSLDDSDSNASTPVPSPKGPPNPKKTGEPVRDQENELEYRGQQLLAGKISDAELAALQSEFS